MDQTLPSDGEPPPLFAGRYRILRPLGRGASKEVYLAHDERLDRDVALALFGGSARGERAEARVQREIQITGRLGEHPHIVTVHDAGEHDGVTYLVLRALPGGSLADRLSSAPRRRLSVDEVVRIGSQLADALAHAHAHGVVHRDVKPDNVWLDAAGDAVLGDFGVALDAGAAARLTLDRAVIGTLAYLSPEQARGDPASPLSDLYGLGALLYELVCGRPPFLGDDAAAVIAQHLHAAPEPPSSHAPDALALDAILLALLAKDPADRPRSAAGVRDELAAAADPQTAPGGRPPVGAGGLVGRERVMAALGAACDEALAGRFQLVALAGEAGIGKTRCAEALAGEARRRGCLVAWGACAEDEGAPAYWPWRRALRALAEGVEGEADPEVARLIAGEGGEPTAGADEARFRLLDAVAAFLARTAARQPLVVVLEDLHWADRSSLALLAHVARALVHERLLVLITHRAPGTSSGAPLREALGRLAGAPGFAGLELHGLEDEQVREYAELVAGSPVAPAVAASLRERTLGNPLYVAELVRMLVAEDRLEEGRAVGLPSGLRALVERRVGSLPQATRDLLAVAAVAGTEFSLAVVARAAGLERAAAMAALDPAVAEQLVAPAGAHRYRFSHAVTRDVVYEDQPSAARAERHALLAAILEARALREADQPVAEVAHHAVMAARGGLDPAPALRWSREAAAESIRLLAHAEAAQQLDRALEAADLGELGTADDRLALLMEIAAARRAAGDLEDARRRYRQAADTARRLGDAEALARAVLGYAEFQDYGVVDEAAVALLEEAAHELPEGDSVVRAEVLGRLAARLDAATDQDRRERLHDEAVAMARRIGEKRTLARLLTLSPWVHWRARSGERRSADAGETIALATVSGDPEAALWGHIARHVERFSDGDIEGADADLDAYDRLAGELRQRYYRWFGQVMRATRAIFDGRLQDGRRLAEEAVADNREHEPDSEQEWVVQQLLLARLAERPREVPLEALRVFADQYGSLPLWRALLALAEWTSGDRDAARASFEACARGGLAALPARADTLCTLVLLAEVCPGLADAGHARELQRLLEPYAARNVLTDLSWAAWGPVARPLGLLAAASGEHDRAARHFELAVELTRRWGARPWLAHTICDYASSLPEDPRAVALVPEGIELARVLGLEPLHERLVALADSS